MAAAGREEKIQQSAGYCDRFRQRFGRFGNRARAAGLPEQLTMRQIKCLLATLILAASAASAAADPIDDYITAEMAHDGIPGLAIAIVRDGRLQRAQGYGFANLEHRVPVHPDTLFKTGATGMQLTAAG